MAQTTDTLLLIRPSNFGFNEETAVSNNFQNAVNIPGIRELARQEFEAVSRMLSREHIRTNIMDDVPADKTPDALFPNNWISFHEHGKIVLYPMEAPNRRRERRMEIVEQVCELSGISHPDIIDLTGYEKKGQFLEGTGSIVFDHLHKKAYAALSSRTHKIPLEALAERIGYSIHPFHTRDYTGQPIYHTNVMMSIGREFAVVCDACISSESERVNLILELEMTGRKLIAIDGNQMNAFAGNILEVKNEQGDPFILLSETALSALTNIQRKALEKYATLLPVSIPLIEKVGGGGIRCMVAEVFLRKENRIPQIVIKSPSGAREFEDYYSLRWKVLRAPWNQPKGSEQDDQETTSRHFMATLPGGRIIGVARLQEMAPGTAQVRYMAVDPDYHGKGIGKQLMQSMESEAKETGFNRIFLQARENAVPFYKALGYKIIEKTFLLYGEIQHFSMEKSVK